MKSIYSLLVVFFVIVYCSCGETSPSSDAGKVEEITSATLSPTGSDLSDGQISKERFVSLLNSTTNAQLIDVRTPEEFSGGSIEGSLNIDFYSEGFHGQLKSLDKGRPVFIYCKSGGRSGKTYKVLKDMGVGKVYDLKGGYSGWK